MTNNTIMKSLNFGVEIEFTGCKRERAARVLADHFGNPINHTGNGYDTRRVMDSKGRYWKIMSDSSINTQRKRQNNATGEWEPFNVHDGDCACELVTPILQYEDIDTLQEIIRKLRKEAHAFTNTSCGLHVHVGAEQFTINNLASISKIFYSQEDLIYKAIECDSAHRNTHYCKKTDPAFIERLAQFNPKTRAQMSFTWYGDGCGHNNHYDDSRYHGLNLHAFFTKGTVEFRCFNSTLHAGKVKSYIQLFLAIAQQALTQTRATAKKRTVGNEKYAFRCWLLRLGLIGEEFATCRKHLLANLDGNCAWKGGKEQADAHREAQRAA